MRMTRLLITKTLDPFTRIPYTAITMLIKIIIAWMSSFVKSHSIFRKSSGK